MAQQKDQSPGSSEAASIKGLTKAAILLIALDRDCSAAILRNLDQDTVEELTREIAQLDLIDPAQRGHVVEEFYNLALARQYVKSGGVAYARGLLERALSPDQAAPGWSKRVDAWTA